MVDIASNGSGGGCPADPALLECLEGVRGVLGRPGYAFSDGEVLENLRLLGRLTAIAHAVKLMFVQEVQARPGILGRAGPGVRPGGGAVVFLTEGLRQSRARAVRDVAAAAALVSGVAELPELAAALGEGDVSREHVDVAVSTLSRIPRVLKKKLVPGPDGEDGEGRTGAQVIDHVLTEEARHLPPTTVERLGRQIVHRLDPERAERFDADAFERRACSIGEDFARMGMYRLIVDPATHLQLRGVIARFSAPRPPGTAVDADGVLHELRDTRTLWQRQADAVTDLILAGAAGASGQPRRDAGLSVPAVEPEGRGGSEAVRDDPTAGRDGPTAGRHEPTAEEDPACSGGRSDQPQAAEPGAAPSGRAERSGRSGGPGGSTTPTSGTEVCLVVTLDQLAASYGADDPAARGAGLARMSLAGHTGRYPGATVHPDVVARLSCDSPIRRIVVDDKGAVLHHGRARRFASPGQKRALAVRDGGCVVPGCPVPAEWSDAHHVIAWESGGVTDVDAMVLLCRAHHTAHHAGVYDIEMRDGVPWVRPPSWVSPDRPWLRNTTHGHARVAEAVARLLGAGPEQGRRGPGAGRQRAA